MYLPPVKLIVSNQFDIAPAMIKVSVKNSVMFPSATWFFGQHQAPVDPATIMCKQVIMKYPEVDLSTMVMHLVAW